MVLLNRVACYLVVWPTTWLLLPPKIRMESVAKANLLTPLCILSGYPPSYSYQISYINVLPSYKDSAR